MSDRSLDAFIAVAPARCDTCLYALYEAGGYAYCGLQHFDIEKPLPAGL